MNEIRFNNPMRQTVPLIQKEPMEFPKEKEPKPKTQRSFKKFFIVVSIILLLTALVVLFKFSGGVNFLTTNNGVTNLTHKADPLASDYYAVFLADDQVYFGEIVENNTNEMTMINTYRMQPNGQTYSLVKLTDEAFGSTNQIFINRSQILFYEQLRKDSQVVKLIEQK
ncbi:MAG: hypothetical protein AAB446_00100 [Patescibacteria group bacterium]